MRMTELLFADWVLGWSAARITPQPSRPTPNGREVKRYFPCIVFPAVKLPHKTRFTGIRIPYKRAIRSSSRPRGFPGRPILYSPPVFPTNRRVSSFSKWRERAEGEMPVASRNPSKGILFPTSARIISMRRQWVKPVDCRMMVLKGMDCSRQILKASSKPGAK